MNTMQFFPKGLTRPWIFEAFPWLEQQLPWTPLVDAPTPVQPLKSLSKRFNRELWIKKDDITSSIYGGNKPRKLEFILGQARSQGRKHLVTIGGLGTNHGLATAIFGRKLGFQVTLGLFNQPLTRHVQNNLLLCHDQEAEMVYTGSILKAILWYYGKKRITCPGAYFIAPGGSNLLGILGYVDAGLELAIQIKRKELPLPKVIFLAAGSGGTMAGLVLGLRLAGLNTKVIGVQVAPKIIANSRTVLRMADRSLKALQRLDQNMPKIRLTSKDLSVDHGYYGRGYGFPTDAGRKALKIMADTEGINLDLTYTGKAFGGFLNYAKTVSEAGPALFWNTFNSVQLFPPAKGVKDLNLPKPFHQFFHNSSFKGDDPSLAAR